MEVPLVMTIIGKDRTGVVESVARIVTDNGGNWLESRMCRLGGEFAGILRIHVPESNREALMNSLQGLQRQGLAVVIRRDDGEEKEAARKLVSLDLVGHDRPGIVHEVAAVLARRGINVEDLATKCMSAPMSGEMLFKAAAQLRLPASCTISELRKDLEQVADNLIVDISLIELPHGAA